MLFSVCLYPRNLLSCSYSQSGDLPIHVASMYGHLEVVRFLLECDPSTVSARDGVSDESFISLSSSVSVSRVFLVFLLFNG